MNEELRDVFAMAALAGLLAHHGKSPFSEDELGVQLLGKTFAEEAYQYADEMIKAREQQ